MCILLRGFMFRIRWGLILAREQYIHNRIGWLFATNSQINLHELLYPCQRFKRCYRFKNNKILIAYKYTRDSSSFLLRMTKNEGIFLIRLLRQFAIAWVLRSSQ